MKRKLGGTVLALALAVGLGVVPLQAQRGAGFMGRAAGPNAGQSLDVLLDSQDRLELTEDQLAQLLELKATMDGEVTPLADEIKALRERIWAGEVDRAEGFRQMKALRGELMIASAPLMGRVQEILTVEQHQKLQATMWESRPGMGRGGAMQGRGGWGAPQGQLRGSRGGFGPRQGVIGQGRAPALGFRRAAPRGPYFSRGNRAPNIRPCFRRGGGGIPPVTPSGGGDLYPLG